VKGDIKMNNGRRKIDWRNFSVMLTVGIVAMIISVPLIMADFEFAIFGLILLFFGVTCFLGSTCFLARFCAEEKGYYDLPVCRLVFFFGIIGWLFVIALPDRDSSQFVEKKTDSSSKNYNSYSYSGTTKSSDYNSYSRTTGTRGFDDELPHL
jgi:hypothetical protein